MDRRSFLAWVGVGWVASCLPVAIVACSSTPNAAEAPEKATKTDRAGELKLGSLSELNQAGQLLNETSPLGPVLVIRDPAHANALMAVNPTCTHKGCTVAWKPQQAAFVCPCHKAKFSADGKVLAGPARKPLKTYQATIEGDAVFVKKG